jgi:signal transduction histidine kinase
MGRYSVGAKLSPEEAISEAKVYFGEGGLGLAATGESSCRATLTGAGGYVTVTAGEEGNKTNVELETYEWDDYVKQFILTSLEPLATSTAAIENARSVEALRQRTAELEARNKDLEAFARAVAHDLKAPLAVVLGFADLLKEGHDEYSSEELGKYLDTIARNGQRMKAIIDELLLQAEADEGGNGNVSGFTLAAIHPDHFDKEE